MIKVKKFFFCIKAIITYINALKSEISVLDMLNHKQIVDYSCMGFVF